MSRDQAKRRAAISRGRLWRNRRAFAVIALFLWILVGAFTYVWCRVQVVNLGYRLSEAHRVHSRLVDDNKKLHLELARLRAPERVEQVATRQLGLKHPNKDQVVLLP